MDRRELRAMNPMVFCGYKRSQLFITRIWSELETTRGIESRMCIGHEMNPSSSHQYPTNMQRSRVVSRVVST